MLANEQIEAQRIPEWAAEATIVLRRQRGHWIFAAISAAIAVGVGVWLPDRSIVAAEDKKPAESKPSGKENKASRVRRMSSRDPLPIAAEIDREIDLRLAEAKLVASPPSDDAEFLRRVTIDITGQIPTYAAARAFLDSTDTDKRRALIDVLLADPAYGRRFGAAWKRLIQPKPASSGKPQIDKVTPWLAEQFNQNRGWNEVVRELLTTGADISREPQGYFLAVNSESLDPKPNLLAASTARLFLGVQLGCAECHNHPFAEWKQTEFWNLAAFFSRLHKRSKSDYSLTEESSESPTAAEIKIGDVGQAAGMTVPARFLDGGDPKLDAAVPLRNVLADWITADDNPYFARVAVNRLWAQMFGRGLVEPLDGFQPHYVPSHPAVLDRLAAEFTASGYDLQHIIRILCNTRAYQRTSRPLSENENDAVLLSHVAVKVLSPEVLFDSLTMAVNCYPVTTVSVGKTGKPPQREVLVIGSRDEFVNFFSGPAAESSANEYAHGIPQLLRLMNAEALNVGAPLAKTLAERNATLQENIDTLYLATLSRRPTDAERDALAGYIVTRQGTEQAYAGALWILLNTSEFVLNR